MAILLLFLLLFLRCHFHQPTKDFERRHHKEEAAQTLCDTHMIRYPDQQLNQINAGINTGAFWCVLRFRLCYLPGRRGRPYGLVRELLPSCPVSKDCAACRVRRCRFEQHFSWRRMGGVQKCVGMYMGTTHTALRGRIPS